MTDKPEKSTPETGPGSESASGGSSPRPTPASSRPPQPGNSSAPRGAQPPRPAVNRSGDGLPVDTLSFDPEEGDWVGKTRRWVEQNPVLAVVGAAAGGLLIGKLVSTIIPDPEPETFTTKVERRARDLADHSRDAASDAGVVVSKQLAVAAEALTEASKAVSEGARRGYGEAKDFGSFLAETVGETVADRASKWLDKK